MKICTYIGYGIGYLLLNQLANSPSTKNIYNFIEKVTLFLTGGSLCILVLVELINIIFFENGSKKVPEEDKEIYFVANADVVFLILDIT